MCLWHACKNCDNPIGLRRQCDTTPPGQPHHFHYLANAPVYVDKQICQQCASNINARKAQKHRNKVKSTQDKSRQERKDDKDKGKGKDTGSSKSGESSKGKSGESSRGKSGESSKGRSGGSSKGKSRA